MTSISPPVTVLSPSGKKIQVPTGIFINNEFVTSTGGQALKTTNPATGRVICEVQCGSSADVDIAVSAAKHAFATSWGRKSSPSQRVTSLTKLADLIEQYAEELGELESLDNGKPRWIAASMDVMDTAACFRYFGGLADKIEGKTMELDESKKMAMTRVEAIGVCGAIIPWNYPLMMLAWKLAPALAAGNCVILKPAEQTPLTALRIAELSVQAGFPPGVLSVINGYGSQVGHAIASHMEIDKVAFTGSTATGRRIMEAAAHSNIKKVSVIDQTFLSLTEFKITLELGGKSPVVVFDDVDIEKAIPWVALAILFNQGQDCTAGSRLFVQSGIYDKFVTKLVDAMSQHGIGDPFDDRNFQGPQISKEQQQRILDYIQSGKEQGAKVELGGEVWQGASGTQFEEGFWVQPTIFSGCKPGMRIVDEEIFGPVLAVAKFDTEEEAIDLANATAYGLGAGIFSEGASRCMRVAGAIHAGTVWVNNYAMLSNAVPFGGMKQSGLGRELGVDAIREYTQVKAIHWNYNEILDWPLRG